MPDERQRTPSSRAARRIAIEVGGWTLVVAGLAALVLPGPGLLALFAGLAVLSQQYEWAERRLEPVKRHAFRTASDSVQTWQRITAGVVGALALAGLGVVWIVKPSVPAWWPVHERFWLVGGWGTGTTLILSSLIALGLIVYSFRRFRANPYAG